MMHPTKKESHFNMSADYLRTLAILAVVFIHTSTKTLEVGKFDIQHLWWTLLLNQLLRFAVPLFFLISGFLLELNYRENFQFVTFFKKRFSKILIPYFFWSIFYYFGIFHFSLDKKFFYALLVGDASYQLYFIPTLLIFYILFPFFHHFKTFFFNKYILVFLLLSELGFLTYDYYVGFVYPTTPIRTAILNYVPFIFGVWASHHKERIVTFISKFKSAFIISTVVLGVSIFTESFVYFLSTRKIGALYNQYRPLVLLYTLILSGLLYVIFESFSKYKHFFMLLSRLSFFVFFVHVAIIYLYWYTLGVVIVGATHGAILHVVLYDPFVFSIVGGISFCLAYLFNKKMRLSWLMG